jgi:predicted nucleic acid-binding protein
VDYVDLVSATPGLRLVPGEPELAILAARLAADLQLRGPDATYVAVAHHLNIPLVTWDKEQLHRAARLIATSTP